MAWFKVDDGFWSHPKTAQLSDAATALWVRAGAWSAQHLTDGRIPYTALRFFRARRRSAMELVDAGLWSDAGDAFVFHGWDEYQPSKSQVEARREATRNRVNTWRERQRNGVTEELPPDGGNAPPDPTRPDPTHTDSKESDKKPRGARGTRVPRDFTITDDLRDWAARETPHVDVDRKLGEWIDFWTGVAGKAGYKSDWVATWRNGMRKQEEFALRDIARFGAPARQNTPPKEVVG